MLVVAVRYVKNSTVDAKSDDVICHFSIALTKWVPNPDVTHVTRNIVEKHIDTSMRRMGVDVLDMVQFHWWDYSDKRYLDALSFLAELQDEGKIVELSLTNFNTRHLERVVKRGIKISSNQVQFSLIDRRPLVKMIPFCKANGISLFAYGVIGGGLFTERFIGCNKPMGPKDLNTASLLKYKQMVDAWGNWELFKELLEVMSGIAKAHNVSVANVATRYILDQPAVAGVIVGCRFGAPGAEHINNNLKVFDFVLEKLDIEKMEAVLKKGNDLFLSTGDCGDEYRN